MEKSASRNSGRSGGKSVFTGVLIGLALGAVLAVGIALWITGNNPFGAAKPETPAPVAPQPAPPPTPETAPSFDFYKVLPSDAPGKMPSAPETAPEPSAALYYLQAGAFQNPSDADNLKAQLALLGIETMIQTREVDGKIFHRVRVGPFYGPDEINKTRELLTQNNIPATLVKEIPPTQETP